jgi:hypothetical protein
VRLPFFSPVPGHLGIPKQCRAMGAPNLLTGAFLYRQREREAAGCVLSMALSLPRIRGGVPQKLRHALRQ